MKKKAVLIISVAIIAALLAAGITAGVLINRNGRADNEGNGALVDQAGNGGDDAADDSDKEPPEEVFAVWWWDNRLDETYLEFAVEQGVNEIYYYASSFSERI